MKRIPIKFIAAFLSLSIAAVLILSMAGCSGSATTKSTATLVSISVTPYSPSDLAVGSTQRFIATGIYSDGTTPNITSQVTWTSSNNSIASIATGLATGVAIGSTSITASQSGITSPSVTLTVITSASGLSSIAITPAFPVDLGVGASQQLTAVGTYSDGTTADITSKVTWVSSNTAVAAVFANGAVTGEGSGTANITAALSKVTSQSLKLTVKAVLALLITPAASPRNLDVSAVQQFSAIATYSNGASADISSQVTWLSSNTQVATIYANRIPLSGTIIINNECPSPNQEEPRIRRRYLPRDDWRRQEDPACSQKTNDIRPRGRRGCCLLRSKRQSQAHGRLQDR